MDNIIDVLHAVINSYPSEYRRELTTNKMNLLVYLIDWHLRINRRPGIPSLVWVNDSYGPSAREVQSALQRRTHFKSNVHKTNSGRDVIYFSAIGSAKSLSSETGKSVDHVLKLDKDRRIAGSSDPGAEFKRLVLSTYGIMHTEKGSPIDIQSQADKYRKVLGNDKR